MKVLHLASFSGNSGDILNHSGFRPWFQNQISSPIKWANFEIRDVYRGDRSFKSDLLPASAGCDLLVVGGGNYLELWPSNTSTGTSLDFSPELLDSLEVPVFFNALGVDLGQGISQIAQKNFPPFIARLQNSDQFLLSVRNDGSLKALSSLTASGVETSRIPDHGFFSKLPLSNLNFSNHRYFPKIGINIAQDMADIRFEKFGGINAFIETFVAFLVELWTETKSTFIFFAHVKSDLLIASQIIDQLPDKIAREFVEVAKLNSTQFGSFEMFEQYTQCDLVLANRFHSNVFAIANCIPVIGLSNYPQISNLYEEIGLTSMVADIHEPSYAANLVANSLQALSGVNEIKEQLREINRTLLRERSSFLPTLHQWFASNQLKEKLI